MNLPACVFTLGFNKFRVQYTTTVQNRAIEKIATLLNQAIEAEIKQAYAGIASQVRGLAEKLAKKWQLAVEKISRIL